MSYNKKKLTAVVLCLVAVVSVVSFSFASADAPIWDTVFDLLNRVGILESDVAFLDVRITDHDTTIADLQTQIATLESENAALNQLIDSLKSETRYLPLVITESAISQYGSEYSMTLTIVDWKQEPVTVSCIVLTTGDVIGGTASQVKVLDETLYPSVFPIQFNEIDTPDWTWSTTEPIVYDLNPGTTFIHAELICDQNYAIGEYYFFYLD